MYVSVCSLMLRLKSLMTLWCSFVNKIQVMSLRIRFVFEWAELWTGKVSKNLKKKNMYYILILKRMIEWVTNVKKSNFMLNLPFFPFPSLLFIYLSIYSFLPNPYLFLFFYRYCLILTHPGVYKKRTLKIYIRYVQRGKTSFSTRPNVDHPSISSMII